MLLIGHLLVWATLSGPVTPKLPQGDLGHPSGLVMADQATADAQQASQTVVAFLNWYKTHMLAVSKIELVNQRAGKPYSVNLKNGERYLAYLKRSNRLTDTYLNHWRTFFRERNEGFRLTPQYEGPPTGFDYDLVMLNQEVDGQLASLKSLKMGKVTVVNDRATVAFTLLDAYEFWLVRQNNRWLINEILNSSQE